MASRSQCRAVVLLSGGLDSYTAAAIAQGARASTLYALTIRYGQRHAREIEAARAVARALGVERHLELDVDLRAHRRLVADRRTRAVPQRSRSRRRPTSRRPTCRRATRSSCRSRSAGPKCSARATSSSASTRSTTPAIPTAGPSSSRAFERSPTLATRAGVEGAPLSRCTRRCIALTQGRHHPARPRARPRLRPDAQLLRSRRRTGGPAAAATAACCARKGFAEAGVADPAARR